MGAELRKPAVRNWVSTMENSNLLLGGVIGVMHPSTFSAGVKCIKAIQSNIECIAKSENLEEVLDVWTSPLIAASVINNRNTPVHRDNGATYCSMDFLTSTGSFTQGVFMVPGLGFRFLFKSGTLIGLLGRIVPHGADVSGERLCYAQYLREDVLHALGVEKPDWVNVHSIF
jgi:hypothetical protein